MTVQIRIDGPEPYAAILGVRRASHREHDNLPPDTRVDYDVELHRQLGGALHIVGETSVDHRVGDGPLILASRALDAIAYATVPRPVVLA
jgi:hypothetical protein